MDARRRRTLPAAAAVIRELMRALDVDKLSTSERSLRDGLIQDWIQRHRPQVGVAETDPRTRSVLSVMKRYAVHQAHARQVERIALELFDGIEHGLTAEDRRLLADAALLHDLGHHIAGADHHKHGAYLVRHTRMYGFTAPETEQLAMLVRYHRAPPKPTHSDFSRMGSADRGRIRLLSGLLRAADALDRSHDQPVGRLDVSDDGEQIVVKVHAAGPCHIERWAVGRRKPPLEAELGRPIVVEWPGDGREVRQS
jgi:exopolyphosphatase/guanosine-5'-triphosphate,3'-diphosphate pyrophosphatase